MATDFISAVLEYLQAQQLLTPPQVTQLVQQTAGQGINVLTAVENQHLVSSEQLAKAKAAVLNINYIDLLEQQVAPDVLRLIPPDVAENYQLVPFQMQDEVVSVACVSPEDYHAVEVLDFIGRQQKVRFQYFSATAQSVRHVLRQYGSLNSEVQEALASADAGDIELAQSIEDAGAETEVVKTAPVSKMISVILKHAIEGAASDVHIEPVSKETRVRYRVDGVLHTSLVLPGKVHKSLVARIKVLANLKLDETRLPQDGRFKMKYENRDIEFRVSTLPLLENEKVVMRILDTSKSIITLEELGFRDRNLQRVMLQLKRPHGLILVTGPTGSGKSTTLYSMLAILNQEEVNIITLEDPVEYNLAGVAQSQMKPEIGLSFANGLRSVLRQDPDIIMVGEIRDNETAELAIHAALTGHKVLSTLHTNDAIGAIPRLLDMGVEGFLIASALNVVVAQRLVRRLCQSCKQLVQLEKSQTEEIIAEIKLMPVNFLPQDVSLLPPFKAYRSSGCAHCENTGYHGRVAINEVLENTPALQQLISDGEINNLAKVDAELKRQGVFSLRQDGLIKVFRGLSTLEEVWNATK